MSETLLQIPMAKLDALKGCDPSSVYELARECKFKVLAWNENRPYPYKPCYKVLYFRVDEDGFVESVWCNENHIVFA